MNDQRPDARSQPWLQLAVNKGLLSAAEVKAALSSATTQTLDPGDALVKALGLTAERVAQLKAEAANTVFVPLLDYEVEAAALALVPESVARAHHVLPLYRIDQALTVAMPDPWDVVAIDAVRARANLPLIHPVVATPEAIQKAIDRWYGRQVVDQAAKPLGAEPVQPRQTTADSDAPEAGPGIASDADEVSIVKLVDALMGDALELRASDIHLEPDAERTRVRYRIDGILREIKQLPASLHEPVCSRIKILAKLDIAERRLPQDGHVVLTKDARRVDLRISTYPTIHGENVVLRLLDQAAVRLQLSELGWAPDALARVEPLIQRPHGMVLATGPTGSGKTTTLYAALAGINSITKNIMTIEDPVEYELPLIRQTQVHVKAGITFAAGLRSILRQDPDVIMVGEIRDQETADIAVQAALTGHLVLSTLHTNDAAGAITRLLDIGAEPFLLSSTLLAVVAQRLVRRLCVHCQEGSRPTQALRQRYPELTVVYRARGCPPCRQTGFAGRVGIFELLVIDEAMRELITARGAAGELRRQAKEQGMRTMRADGLLKVQQGLTTVEELDRVVPPEESST